MRKLTYILQTHSSHIIQSSHLIHDCERVSIGKYNPARQSVKEADEAPDTEGLDRSAHEVQDDKYSRCLGYRNGKRVFIGNARSERANQPVINKSREIRKYQLRTKLRIPRSNITAQ